MGANSVSMNPAKIEELANKVDAWAQKSFPVHLPAWGVVEEIGELTHCFLKRRQGIRGFTDPVYFAQHTRDALGDVGIYCLHSMALNQVASGADFPDPEEFDIDDNDELQEKLGQLAEAGAWLMQGQSYDANSLEIHCAILSYCRDIAKQLGWDYETILEETWLHVSTRKGATNEKMTQG